MNHNYHIRTAQASDLDQMVEILVSNSLFEQYGITAKKARILLEQALLSDSSVLWTIHQESSCLGFAWIELKAAFARSNYLRLLAVNQHCQGLGLGKRLIQYYETQMDHPAGIFLLATHENQRARDFYSKLGYSEIGTVPSYVIPGLDEVIYFKPAHCIGIESKLLNDSKPLQTARMASQD